VHPPGAARLYWAEIAAARFLIGALIAVGLASARGTSLRITDRPSTWRRSIFGTLAAIGSFYALASSRIGLGDAATLGATAPIFVALLSGPLLGEPVGRKLWRSSWLSPASRPWSSPPSSLRRRSRPSPRWARSSMA